MRLMDITNGAKPRSRAQRRHDTEQRLTHDVDVGVAAASVDGPARRRCAQLMETR
jgi:hypothetical protein